MPIPIPVCAWCGTPTTSAPRLVEVLLDHADAREGLDGRRLLVLPLCHDCAEKVCTCSVCTAFVRRRPEQGTSWCRSEPAGCPARAHDRCRQWEQAFPVTAKLLEELLGPAKGDPCAP